MKKLTLILKNEYFQEILAGTKKVETREIRPGNAKKYCEFDRNGDLTGPKRYDTIQFYMGYETNRPAMEVKVAREEIRILQDEKGNNLTYMHKGEEFVEAVAVYDLGEIVTKHNC